MGRIRWVGVLCGGVATFAAFFLLFVVLGSRVFVPLYPEGALPTGLAWYLHLAVATLLPLTFLLAAFFAGSIVVGRLVATSPGLNGSVCAALVSGGGFACLAGPLIPWVWRPISNPGEVYTRSENLGNLIEVSVVFCGAFPLIVLAGYLGGRFGGRFRMSTA